MVQGIFLKDGTILITQIEEVMAELGEPNCRIIDPYIFDENENEFQRWMCKYTEQTQFMLTSESIFTIFTPKLKYIDHYKLINGIIENINQDENVETQEVTEEEDQY